ncbi:hypothetical protein SAMN06265379_101113 [Saccharicrinis carchari]|uniref:Endonuclease/exonuclease/phosphatase domain-containing protein n=1 Tax=Saccharicrinis carchari TaxID=1168039 RepID=A0A521AFT4_SACCC|nr:endonuclease/exonuclease/phosphatase family protein [Saccharicrinis carchari]SMO33674.1 hypothetical protein SAMN06265379_101113 [Saccharicrinis carchari]
MIQPPTLERTKELRKSKLHFCFLILVLNFPLTLLAQNNGELGVMFYNVENLFDTKNDSLKSDDEFTPFGDKFWTYTKYSDKLKNISRVILEAGGWNPPFVIGLCEVENKKVLNDLVWKTGLNHLNYHIIHHESPDERGIDVALLYRNNLFTPLESIPIKVDFGKGLRSTRDLLYVFGLLKDSIPLHVFVAHFPSRYGGVQNTKPLRYKAAQLLTDTISYILHHDANAQIIAMGDFNDDAEDESMQYLIKNGHLVNLSPTAETIGNAKGTLKYQYAWNTFDQFLLSKNLIDTTRTFFAETPMKILDFPFLLEADLNFTGTKPFRTYVGYKYNGGYSDHLPIWLNFRIIKR